jgi:hypothetical protein
MGTRARCLALAALFALAVPARASDSVEVRGGLGPGIWSSGGTVDLDLGSAWSMTAANDYTAVSGTAAPSLTDLAALNFSDQYTDAWAFKAGADFSNDSLNQIIYAGPDLGFTYTADRAAADKGDQAGAVDDGTLWSLSFDAAINGYAVNLGANTSAGVTAATKKTDGVPYTVTTDERNLTVTQFYPNLTLELPCFGGVLVPSILYGQDFYDQNPAVIAYVINRRFELGNGSYRVGNLTGALYTETVSASLLWNLPYQWTLDASFGESQMIAPYAWAATTEVNLGAQLTQTFSVKLGWSDTVELGVAQPEALASVCATF